MRLLSINRSRQRRGILLLIVLSMLTLFALLGISFVLVAQSQETASRIAREAKVLNADATEWMNLYGGSPKNAATNLSRIRGRYDQNSGTPAPYGAAVTTPNATRTWAQVDYNGMVDATGSQSSPYVLPTAPGPSSYLGFPFYPPATFGNGGAAENTNHASIYSALRPRGTNRRFPIASAARLLRLGGTGSDMLVSDAARLSSGS